jgi:hypothetical protein
MTAEYKSGDDKQSAQDVVVLVHGIRDFALWQSSIRDTLTRAGFVVEPTNFGRFSLMKFLVPIPFFRQRVIRAVSDQIRIVKQHNPAARISFIAHSFGTYVIAQLIKRDFDLSAHRIIFCGSVVSHRFPFQDYQGRFHGNILNEVGTRDVWPAIAHLVTWGYGNSGTYGFRRPLVRDRWHSGAGHGYFLSATFCEKFWVPYLKSEIFVDGDSEPEPPPRWLAIISFFQIKYLIAFVALITALASLPNFVSTAEKVSGSLIRTQTPMPQEQELPPVAKKQVSLLWECDMTPMPNVIPGGGRLNVIQATINDENIPTLSFGSQVGEPGSSSGYDNIDASFVTQRCSLINFGNETIFNIPLTFKVWFATLSNGHNKSKWVANTDMTILIASLDKGRDSPFVVYLFTLNRRFVALIELPTTASYIIANDNTKKEARFLPSSNYVALFPATDKEKK